MKNYTLILLLVATMIACRNSNTKNSSEIADEENDKFIEYVDSLEAAAQESFSAERLLTWGFVDFGKTYSYDDLLKTPPSLRQSITEIDAELSILFDDHCYWREGRQWEDGYQRRKAIRDRLLFYLKHPATFTEDMSLLSSKINIVTSDDGLYKFYSFAESQGTSGWTSYLNYIQYQDPNGETVWIPYGNHWRDNILGVEDVWQIEEKGETYYVVKWHSYGSKYMEIISIDPTKYNKSEITPWGHSSAIVNHPEFFPDTEFIEDYICIYDENGESTDNVYRTDYRTSVCSNGGEYHITSDYTFDPKTRTITTFTTNNDEQNYIHISIDKLEIPE